MKPVRNKVYFQAWNNVADKVLDEVSIDVWNDIRIPLWGPVLNTRGINHILESIK